MLEPLNLDRLDALDKAEDDTKYTLRDLDKCYLQKQGMDQGVFLLFEQVDSSRSAL